MDIVFKWMLNAGWTEHSAHSVLLLLMVLFKSIHVGSCRSETKSALKPSPFRILILLSGAIGALVVHRAMMNLPIGYAILGAEPVGPGTWFNLSAFALVFFAIDQLHNRAWWLRRRFRPWMAPKLDSQVSP